MSPGGLGISGCRALLLDVDGCLHLKSAVTRVGADALLINPRWVSPSIFDGWRIINVDDAEPAAANALRIGESVIYPQELTRTRRKLEAEGLHVIAVPAGELAKAEGGVTCCSLTLTFSAPPRLRVNPFPVN